MIDIYRLIIIKKTTHFERLNLCLLQQFSYNTHLKFLILLYIQFFLNENLHKGIITYIHDC